MLALIVHADRKPPLSKGSLLVPLASWDEARIPLRILREESKKSGRQPDHFMTLVKVPEHLKVAVIVGRPRAVAHDIEFVALEKLSSDDREIIEKSFEMFRDPGVGAVGVDWLARLVLGEPLPAASIKWTKDFRLLQEGARNATTKRT